MGQLLNDTCVNSICRFKLTLTVTMTANSLLTELAVLNLNSRLLVVTFYFYFVVLLFHIEQIELLLSIHNV